MKRKASEALTEELQAAMVCKKRLEHLKEQAVTLSDPVTPQSKVANNIISFESVSVLAKWYLLDPKGSGFNSNTGCALMDFIFEKFTTAKCVHVQARIID